MHSNEYRLPFWSKLIVAVVPSTLRRAQHAVPLRNARLIFGVGVGIDEGGGAGEGDEQTP